MSFEIDNQTLKDLEIFKSSSGGLCLIDYLNFTNSAGGRDKLKDILSKPISSREVLKGRIDFIEFLYSLDASELNINKNDLEFIEYYLKYGDRPTQNPSLLFAIENTIVKKLTGQKNELYIIERGIVFTLFTFDTLFKFFDSLNGLELPHALQSIKKRIDKIKDKDNIKRMIAKDYLIKDGGLKKIKILEAAQIDHTIRLTNLPDTRFLLNTVYELDALLAVKKAMQNYKLVLPNISPNSELKITGVRHPFIKEAVCNDLEFSSDQNTMFISGPNMAGKSTLLKAVGICVFLAHCGFPVPAKSMNFSPLHGLYSTINLPDKLGLGQSHFYAEVLRLKKIAEKLQESDKIFVIFDELFRGTNVKDAYEGSLAVIKAFSEIRSSYFIISTHFVELTKQLKNIDSIQFKFLETTNIDGTYKYSYKVKEGVSEDRLGMYIIEKEGLLELLDKVSKQ